MADIQRNAEAAWDGDLRSGKGYINSSSDVFNNVPYSFATRFEQAKGTNPEELIAAAHAACFSMALSGTLSRQGHPPQHIETRATCFLTPQQSGGFKITKMRLETRAKVEGIDEATFQQAVKTTESTCPVSQALSALEIEATGTLL